MFKVSFFVDDKQLAPVMHAISGRVRNLEVVPVVNAAVAANGHAKPAGPAGTMSDLLIEKLQKDKSERITRSEVKAWLETIGRPNASAGTLLSRLVAAKVLKPAKGRGKQSYYGVVHG